MVIKITESQLKVLENYLNNNILTEAPITGPKVKGKTKGKFSGVNYKKIKKFTTPKFFGSATPEELMTGLDQAFEGLKKKWQLPTILEKQKTLLIKNAFDKGKSNLDYKEMTDRLSKSMDAIAKDAKLMENPEIKNFYGKVKTWLAKPGRERLNTTGNLIVTALLGSGLDILIELPFRDSIKDVTVAKPFLKTWPIEKKLLELLRTEGSEIMIDGTPTTINSDDANSNAESDIKVTITKSGEIFVIVLNPPAQIDMKPFSPLKYNGETFYYETPSNIKIKTLLTTVGSSIEIKGKGLQQITDEDIKHNNTLIPKDINVAKTIVKIGVGAKINGVIYNNFIWNKTTEDLTAIENSKLTFENTIEGFKKWLITPQSEGGAGQSEDIGKPSGEKDNFILTFSDGKKETFEYKDGNFK